MGAGPLSSSMPECRMGAGPLSSSMPPGEECRMGAGPLSSSMPPGGECRMGASEGGVEDYLPRSCLVTGGAGFIGSHVVNALVAKYGAAHVPVVVVDRLDYSARRANWLPATITYGRFAFVQADIGDKAAMCDVLRRHQIDTVLHFAAQTHVDHSFTNSADFIRDNILGTHNLLQACREHGGIRRFVHVSTDEVYGEVPRGQTAACTEDTVLLPSNPYAATKASAELIVRAFNKSYGLPTIVTRCNNVYGWGQFPDKLIPRFALLMATGQKLTVQGDGSAQRIYVHVSDVTRAFLVLLERARLGETYNIGSANEYSVLDIARRIVTHFCGDDEPLAPHVRFVADRNFNDCRYLIDARKLAALGWHETHPFDQGFAETIDWYVQRVPEFAVAVLAPVPPSPSTGRPSTDEHSPVDDHCVRARHRQTLSSIPPICNRKHIPPNCNRKHINDSLKQTAATASSQGVRHITEAVGALRPTGQSARNGCNSSRARRRPTGGATTKASLEEAPSADRANGPQRVQLESRPLPADRRRRRRVDAAAAKVSPGEAPPGRQGSRPATGATRVAPVAGRLEETWQPQTHRWTGRTARNGCNSSRARCRPTGGDAGWTTGQPQKYRRKSAKGPQRVQLGSRTLPAD